MKIAILNSANMGFYPRFYQDLREAVKKMGDEIVPFATNSGRNMHRPLPDQVLWGNRWNWFVHYHIYKFTGLQDIWSPFSTYNLIRKLKKYNPDLIHLNVVNQWDTSFPMFVRYINKADIPVVWTFHDTRVFTGRCANFDESNCQRWKTGCGRCPKGGIYTPSFIDNSRLQWKLRRKWFGGLRNLNIVTPSQWLADLVRQSFLKDKPLTVINNGIDTTSFSQPQVVEIPQLNGINKKIVLGVAARWQHRKGLDSMMWLSSRLSKEYQIVLVGIAPGQEETLPSNIIGIPRTNSKEELIALYQRADVFVNPTLADNFPTVNIEALGAGLPVVTFRTGGSAECLKDGCGLSVEKGNDEALLNAIIEVTTHPELFTREKCIERSKDFSLAQFDKYVELYHKLQNKKIQE